MARLSKSWGIPIIILGVLLTLLMVDRLLGSIFGLFLFSHDRIASRQPVGEMGGLTVVNLVGLIIGMWMIVLGRKIILIKQLKLAPTPDIETVKPARTRINFYTAVAVAFLPFFILHWNGCFDVTYQWYLVRVGGTHELRPQFIAALASSVIIFGIAICLFELGMRIKKSIQRLVHSTGSDQQIK